MGVTVVGRPIGALGWDTCPLSLTETIVAGDVDSSLSSIADIVSNVFIFVVDGERGVGERGVVE
jgi:hypothetical protein